MRLRFYLPAIVGCIFLDHLITALVLATNPYLKEMNPFQAALMSWSWTGWHLSTILGIIVVVIGAYLVHLTTGRRTEDRIQFLILGCYMHLFISHLFTVIRVV